MKRIIALAIFVALSAHSAMAANDPFLGTWKLDVRRSHYPGGTCPTSMVIAMTTAEHGIQYRSDATYKNGGHIHAEYTAGYDERPSFVLSTHGMLLPVSLKRIDSRTVVGSYTRGFQVVAVSKRVVSADGTRMTITTTSHEKPELNVTTIGIYTKSSD